MKYPTLLALTLSTAVFAAYAGGGDDARAPNGPIASTLTFPLDAAYTKAMTTGVTLNGTAFDGDYSYTMAIAITPVADVLLEGVVSKKSIQSLTMNQNGAVLVADTVSSYYSINPYTAQGASYPDGSYAVQTSNTGNFPTAAKVGDAGTLGTLTLYTSASQTIVKASTQSTWTLEADTANTAFGCTNMVFKDAFGTQIGTGSNCFKIDTSGNFLGMKFTRSVAGKTLVFQ